MKTRNKKVICAISGGVDSSVAAALLKEQGYNVEGIFLKFLPKSLPFPGSLRSAEKVAKKLDIPLKVLDASKEFRKYVINYFIKEYSRGYTPNPCVTCNQKIKFGFLLKQALSLGAEYVATGHYVKVKSQKSALSKVEGSKVKSIYKLLRAKDRAKDQSYFLWTLTQKQLKYLLFPIGDYTKRQVRNLALKFGLPTACRKESQDICFVLEKDYSVFLKRYLKNIKPGSIKTTEGEVVGQHQGLPLYTIGQRKGIGLAGGPFYVVELDFKDNALIVSKNERDLYAWGLKARDISWILGKEPKFPLKIQAQIRYRHRSVPAVIKELRAKIYDVRFKKLQRAVTPGQSVVFYSKDEVLGGGIIETAVKP